MTAVERRADVLHARRTSWAASDRPVLTAKGWASTEPSPRESLQREIDESFRESKLWERLVLAALFILIVGGGGLLLIAQIAMWLS